MSLRHSQAIADRYIHHMPVSIQFVDLAKFGDRRFGSRPVIVERHARRSEPHGKRTSEQHLEKTRRFERSNRSLGKRASRARITVYHSTTVVQPGVC